MNAFLGLNIDDLNMCIYHIDGNRMNNHLNNLRIVKHQQNSWNMTRAKGYRWHKTKKIRAHIYIDAKAIYLGSYKTK